MLFKPSLAPYSPSGPLVNFSLDRTQLLLKIGPKIGKNCHKIRSKSSQNLHQIIQNWPQNWHKIGPKIAQNQPEIGLQNHPEIGPKSSQSLQRSSYLCVKSLILEFGALVKSWHVISVTCNP
jgi:hypothetical protein